MSSKIRRLIASRALGVGLLVLALVLVGCGGKSGSSAGPSDPNPGDSYLDRSWSFSYGPDDKTPSGSITSATVSAVVFWQPSLLPASGMLVTFATTSGGFDSPSGRTDSAGNFSTKYRTSLAYTGLVEVKIYVEGVYKVGSALINVDNGSIVP